MYALVQEARERRVKAKGEHSEFLKEGMFLKDWGLKYNLARYYGLDKAYHAIKSTENRKIQTIRQKVSYQDLVRL